MADDALSFSGWIDFIIGETAELSGDGKQNFLGLSTPAALQLKRTAYNINKSCLNWIMNMLIYRSQKVMVRGESPNDKLQGPVST